MLLLTHILVALSSLGFATVTLVSPSQKKLKMNYLLVAGTLGSGTWLAISTHASLLSACTSGLVYLGIVTALLASSYRSLSVHRK